MQKKPLGRIKYIPILLGALVIIIDSGAGITSSAEEKIRTLGDSISVLRRNGRFSEAAELADEIISLLRVESQVKPFRIADAERLFNTLHTISKLPDSSRASLTRSAHMKDEYDECYKAGRYAEAEEAARAAIEIKTGILGPDHPEVATAIVDLARALQKSANYDSAETLYNKALAAQKKVLGESHPDVAGTNYHLGLLFLDTGALDDSERLLRRALEMRLELLGSEHPDIANNINDIGNLLWKKGDYGAAESRLREALAMQRRLFGNEHAAVATALNNLALPLVSLGRYAEAKPLYLEALAIRRKLLGDNHPDVGNSLNNLAGLLWERGDYAAAEPLWERALVIRRNTLGGDHPNVALGLGNLAANLWKQGNYQEAETLLRESLAIFRKRLGGDHPYIAMTLSNLSAVIHDQENYEAAETLQTEALEIYRRILGGKHQNIAILFNNIAVTHSRKGDFAHSERYLREALAIYSDQLGANHPLVANCHNNLGGIFILQGEYSSAETELKEASNIYRKLFGGSHPALVSILSRLGAVFLHKGEYDNARSVLREASEIFENTRWRVSAKELVRAVYTASDSPYPLLALAQIKSGDKDTAWQSVERDRGRALLDILKTKALRRLTPGELEQEAQLNNELTNLENTLIVLEGDTSASSASRADSIRILLRNLDSRWLDFTNRMAEKYPITEGRAYSITRIQSSLEPNSAIVGWLDIINHHYAHLITPDGTVEWVELSSTPIDSLTDIYRAGVASFSKSSKHCKDLGSAIYRERLAPLEASLKRFKHLYVVPSGPMVGIPVEALVAEDNKYVSDKWNVTYIPSATVLAWLKELPAPESRMALFALADPPFNENQAKAMDSSSDAAELSYSEREQKRMEGIQRDLDSGSRSAIRRLNRLAGSRSEARTIAQLFENSSILLGRNASEQNIAEMARLDELSAFRYIHLATHALLDCRRGERSFLVLSQVDLPDPFEIATSGERMIDGRLTMEEVLREWRLDADLVTLSACETALGKRARGEGYIGFAHAFFRTGARCVLVSLWKVDDRATIKLMNRFYRNMIEKRMSKAESLKEAKNWLRNVKSRSGKSPYSHPYFWAGFILSGDPG